MLERLDAELSETGDDGRPTMYGKVAVVAVVGNEDGAHKISADVLKALNQRRPPRPTAPHGQVPTL